MDTFGRLGRVVHLDEDDRQRRLPKVHKHRLESIHTRGLIYARQLLFAALEQETCMVTL